MDDDSIWLMRSGTAAVKAACRLLPWHGFDEDSYMDEDDPDREDQDEDDWERHNTSTIPKYSAVEEHCPFCGILLK